MKRRIILFAGGVAVLVGLAVLARQHLSVDQLTQREQWLRAWIASHPYRALAAGVGAYFVISLAPGTSGKSIVCGWLYGFWAGLMIVDVGLTAAALVAFGLSRYALRDTVQKRLGGFLLRAERALERDGAFYLLTLRMMHAPFTLVNYGAGASSVHGATFLWTTALGLLPGTMVFVYVGTRLPTLAELAERGAARLLDPSLLVALVAMGAFPLAMRWLVRGIRRLVGRVSKAPFGPFARWRRDSQNTSHNT